MRKKDKSRETLKIFLNYMNFYTNDSNHMGLMTILSYKLL